MRLKDQRGQGLIEYIILVAIIGVATITFVRSLQHAVNNNFAHVINALQGDRDDTRIHKEQITDSQLRKKDFGDFMKGAVNRDGNNDPGR